MWFSPTGLCHRLPHQAKTGDAVPCFLFRFFNFLNRVRLDFVTERRHIFGKGTLIVAIPQIPLCKMKPPSPHKHRLKSKSMEHWERLTGSKT